MIKVQIGSEEQTSRLKRGAMVIAVLSIFGIIAYKLANKNVI